MAIKPLKKWQIKGKRLEDLPVNSTIKKYEFVTWACSSCKTTNNLGPYCRDCNPEEFEVWQKNNKAEVFK